MAHTLLCSLHERWRTRWRTGGERYDGCRRAQAASAGGVFAALSTAGHLGRRPGRLRRGAHVPGARPGLLALPRPFPRPGRSGRLRPDRAAGRPVLRSGAALRRARRRHERASGRRGRCDDAPDGARRRPRGGPSPNARWPTLDLGAGKGRRTRQELPRGRRLFVGRERGCPSCLRCRSKQASGHRILAPCGCCDGAAPPAAPPCRRSRLRLRTMGPPRLPRSTAAERA